MKLIFAGKSVKSKNAGDGRLPLLYLEDDHFDKWVSIENQWLAGRLPDQWGRVVAPHSQGISGRKNFVENDLKILHGMRNEDVDFVATQILERKICVKSTNSKSAPATMMSMVDFCNQERKLRAMKDELMNLFKNSPLPSRKAEYVPYLAADWDALATQRGYTRETMMALLSRILKLPEGEAYFNKRLDNLVKNPKPGDLPDNIKSVYMSYGAQDSDRPELQVVDLYSKKYKCVTYDWFKGNLSAAMNDDADVRAWMEDRSEDVRFLFVCFCFTTVETGKTKARLLEDKRLSVIFDACEVKEIATINIHSPAILITDVHGMTQIAKEIEVRKRRSNSTAWDYHVVHYLPQPDDEFPPCDISAQVIVYVVFIFGRIGRGRRGDFDFFFERDRGFRDRISAVYSAVDSSDETVDREWRIQGIASLNLSTASAMFRCFLKKDILLINLHGGPNITYVGLVSSQIPSRFNSSDLYYLAPSMLKYLPVDRGIAPSMLRIFVTGSGDRPMTLGLICAEKQRQCLGVCGE